MKRRRYEVVVIAASAGGVQALQHLLSELPGDFPLPRSRSRPLSRAMSIPHSAIETGCVDAILPLSHIAPELMRLSNLPTEAKIP